MFPQLKFNVQTSRYVLNYNVIILLKSFAFNNISATYGGPQVQNTTQIWKTQNKYVKHKTNLWNTIHSRKSQHKPAKHNTNRWKHNRDLKTQQAE